MATVLCSYLKGTKSVTAVNSKHGGSVMEKYTVEQRVQIVKIHYQNGANFPETVRKTRTNFGHHNAPSRNTVINLINKFEHTGSVVDAKRTGRPRSARSEENIAMVAVSVDDDPTTSKRKKIDKKNASALNSNKTQQN